MQNSWYKEHSKEIQHLIFWDIAWTTWSAICALWPISLANNDCNQAVKYGGDHLCYSQEIGGVNWWHGGADDSITTSITSSCQFDPELRSVWKFSACVDFLWVLLFLPKNSPVAVWLSVNECIKVCVHVSLWWISVPCRIYSHLTLSVLITGSASTRKLFQRILWRLTAATK